MLLNNKTLIKLAKYLNSEELDNLIEYKAD